MIDYQNCNNKFYNCCFYDVAVFRFSMFVEKPTEKLHFVVIFNLKKNINLIKGLHLPPSPLGQGST